MSTLAAQQSAYGTTPPGGQSSALDRSRLQSVDIWRGFAIVVMAVDHVRVFFSNATFDPTDLSQASAALFLTRWITHFAAPGFVFLAGTGAFLYGARVKDPARLSRFLFTRGLWLILIEMTFVRLAWTFNIDYGHYLLGGVLWMIGLCMILMAGIVRLPITVIGAFGVLMVAAHNLLLLASRTMPKPLETGGFSWLFRILYYGGAIPRWYDGPKLVVLFVVVPWVGVMAAGYAFGAVLQRPEKDRWRICRRLGGAMIVAFVLMRALNLYGDQHPWSVQPRGAVFTALSFLNVSKYPASLLFLLMTLGPMIAALPLLERARGPLARVLETFGRVPFFFYILHIPLIHGLAAFFSLLRYGTVIPWISGNHPMAAPDPPDGYGYSLGVIWLMWALVVVMLYFPCARFAELKARRRDAWLSYF